MKKQLSEESKQFLAKIKGGEIYDCSFTVFPKELDEYLVYLKELQNEFNYSVPSAHERRAEIIKELFAEVGDNCYLEQPFRANWGCNIHVGKNFYANFNATFVDDADIFIGDYVMLAPNVILATAGHPICPELREAPYQFNMPIHIGNRVWIGAGAIVMPGVTIGDDTVIGAGSVVTKDIPSGVVAVGNPCKVMRKISERDYKYYFKDKKIGFEIKKDEK